VPSTRILERAAEHDVEPARAAPRHRLVDGDVVADAAGDVVLQAEADDAVMVGLKSPEQDFAQDRTEGINQRLPQVGPVAPGPGHQRELHRGRPDHTADICACTSRSGSSCSMPAAQRTLPSGGEQQGGHGRFWPDRAHREP